MEHANKRIYRMMIKVLSLFCVVFFPCVAYATPAVVDYVIDGDTFSAYVNLESDIKISVRVRIRNIDTPEIHGACDYETNMALRARDRLSALLPIGTTVDLQNVKDDKYLGRIDANVKLKDGRDVGNILIREKLARAYNGGKRAPWCGKS